MARVSRPDEEEVAPEEVAPAEGGEGGTASGEVAPTRSRFADLSRLLYANQGQGKKMGQAALAKADATAAGANSQLASAQSQYAQQSAAATPKAFAPASAAPTSVGGSGGLTGRGLPNVGGRPIAPGDALPTPSATPGVGRQTTQINSNVAPNIADAQAAAAATYQGPRSLGEAQGVNLEGISQAFNQAGQEYGALTRNPSQQTGGAGRFNDFLIGAESGGDLRSAGKRFQGLRDRFTGAVGNTAPSDAAAAATTKNAEAAQGYIAQDQANQANAATQAASAQHADEVARADDEDAFAQWSRTMDPIQLNALGGRRFFDAHKDEVKKSLQDPTNRRFFGTTYGIGGDQLLNASGYNPDGTRKIK